MRTSLALLCPRCRVAAMAVPSKTYATPSRQRFPKVSVNKNEQGTRRKFRHLGHQTLALLVEQEERAALGARQLARLAHNLLQQHLHVVWNNKANHEQLEHKITSQPARASGTDRNKKETTTKNMKQNNSPRCEKRLRATASSDSFCRRSWRSRSSSRLVISRPATALLFHTQTHTHTHNHVGRVVVPKTKS